MAFEIGDRVRTRMAAPTGHTRLPAYLQRRPGIVARLLGDFPFADERARADAGASKQRLYSIRFDARDVWPEAAPGDAIVADLFEAYIEPAP